MAKKSKDALLNRELGDGASGSVKADMGHDVGKEGYHKSDFGGVEKENHRISDGYQDKDESPGRDQGSNIHSVAHHSVTNELYSGHPEKHGHENKVMKGDYSSGSDESHPGGAVEKE